MYKLINRAAAVSLFIAGVIVSGCSTGTSGGAEPAIGSQSATVEGGSDSSQFSEDSVPNNFAIREVGQFSEGFALVNYSCDSDEDNESESWFGYIDKAGELQFKQRFGTSDIRLHHATLFENGVAYLLSEDESRCMAIDTSGAPLGTFDNVIAYGGGYVVTEEYQEGFEDVSNTYSFFKADGTELYSFEKAGNEGFDIHYLGKGTFGIGQDFDSMSGSSRFYIDAIYNAETNMYVSIDGHIETSASFIDSERALLSTGIVGNDLVVYLLSTNGDVDEIRVGSRDALGNNIRMAVLSENICTIRTSNCLLSYNLTNGEINVLGEQYSNAIDWSQSVSTFQFHDDRCAILLEGADGNTYLGIFDSRWNPVCDPIKVDEKVSPDSNYSDEKIVITGQIGSYADVYNIDGQLVYSIDMEGGYEGSSYSEGLLLCYTRDEGNLLCFDEDGTAIFEGMKNFEAPSIE